MAGNLKVVTASRHRNGNIRLPRLRACVWVGLVLALVGSGFLPTRGDEPASETDSSEPVQRSIFHREGFSPSFSLHGFADTTVLGGKEQFADGEDATKLGFYVGELDLYMVSRLSERFSFLGELVFEYQEDGETRVDLERVFIKYTLSDLFWASLGRRHTPLGYWNETYHHGLLLQPTVDRPAVLRFEDKDGPLPIHSVGVEAGGSVFRGPWGLDYTGGLYNGRGPNRFDVQSFGDVNVNKAVLIKATVSRERSDRILFGPMVYRDEIPPGGEGPGLHAEMDERIYGVHFVYEREQFQLLAEYYDVHHSEQGVNESFNHRGYYAIAVWQPWRWKPYAGYDVLDLEEGDPYYVGIPPYQRRVLGGVRFDPIPFLALKIELRHDELTAVETHGLALQLAYTF